MPRRRRRHPNWLARAILGTCLLAAAFYLFVPSLIEYWRLEALKLHPSYRKLVEQQSARLLGLIWFAFVGGSVGSFLNVVVWRLPRGRSLMGRSHCPWCAVQIKSRDNVPVLGWVLLRGRCRACRLPIAARYPLVEFFVACLFVYMLFLEVLSGGANLPIRELAIERGFLETVYTPHIELLGIYAFHMWMLFHLVTWALIRWDGMQIPRGYALFCLFTGLIAAAAFPWVHPVPAFFGPTGSVGQLAPWVNQAFTGLMGAFIGLLLGNEFDMAWSGKRPQATWFLALVGTHLGWQAAFSVALISTFMTMAAQMWRHLAPGGRPWPLGALILAATLLHLSFWRPAAEQFAWWPGPDTPLQTIALAGLFIVIVQFGTRLAVGRAVTAEPKV